MRVLHLIESMATGGAESLIVEHVRLASPGVESLVVALNRGGPALDAVRALGVPCVLLEKGGDHIGGVRRVAALIRDRGIDVVNGHNPTGGIYGTIAGRWAGARVVVRTEHSIHYPGRHSGVYGAVLEPLLTSQVNAVICICEASRESHVRRLRWADRRFVTILNGISPAPATMGRVRARESLGLAESTPVVLTVGSLTWQKAQHVLIDAFEAVVRRVPGAVLLIAGDGKLREPLVARAKERGVGDAVRFLGNRSDVADLMEAADVFTLSSVREGLSVTLLEAMRASRPAVVTRIGGNAEAVEDGQTGIVVPSEDPPALAEALTALLQDPARAARFGAAGRERWQRKFTAERMVRETEDLYRKFLTGMPARTPLTVPLTPRMGEAPVARRAAGGL